MWKKAEKNGDGSTEGDSSTQSEEALTPGEAGET